MKTLGTLLMLLAALAVATPSFARAPDPNKLPRCHLVNGHPHHDSSCMWMGD